MTNPAQTLCVMTACAQPLAFNVYFTGRQVSVCGAHLGDLCGNVSKTLLDISGALDVVLTVSAYRG